MAQSEIKPLQGQVAVVTGASRGAGRGIALALGEAGATVYVTGRSVRGMPAAPETASGRGTVEDTAEGVTERGGLGIPVQVDHTVDAQVEALFARVHQEQGHLHLLVNNAWGGYEDLGTIGLREPFWAQPMARWDRMFTAGVRSHLLSTRFALPLLEAAGEALIVNTTTAPNDLYKPQWGSRSFYHLAKTTKNEMVEAMAVDFRDHGKPLTVVGLSPDCMLVDRTDLTPEEAVGAQSTRDVGRAVAALAADPNVRRKSGQVLMVGAVAREYGFSDLYR
jgi:NAD(P)-dependent dehydrogenase (short-subunit alcohol dehydrogenase family)